MAWIKLRTDLLNDPAVYRMAAHLKTDRYSIVGRLAAFWGWADQHAVDGVVDGASSQVVDDVVSLPGFADALVLVKWLRVDADRVVIPNHDRHNGANAKERSLKSERQAKWRGKKAPENTPKGVDGVVDGASPTRGEERRGDKKIPPKPPAGAFELPEWIPEKPWADFVAMRRAKGNKVPFTVAAAKGIVAKLDEFRTSGHDVGVILGESVVNGWSSVFEPKTKAGATAAGALAGAI